jgi:hypothetical protein
VSPTRTAWTIDPCDTSSSPTDLILAPVAVVLLALLELLVLTLDGLEAALLVVTVGILEVAAAVVVISAARSSANMSSKSSSSVSCRLSWPFLFFGILSRLKVAL